MLWITLVSCVISAGTVLAVLLVNSIRLRVCATLLLLGAFYLADWLGIGLNADRIARRDPFAGSNAPLGSRDAWHAAVSEMQDLTSAGSVPLKVIATALAVVSTVGAIRHVQSYIRLTRGEAPRPPGRSRPP